MSTKASRAHMGRVKRMSCVCCRLMGSTQTSVSDVHHIRQDREERNDWLTIPLCHNSCHQGPLGVHGDKTFLRILKLTEWGLLAVVMEELEAMA
jgi:hypothetical protein